MINAEMARSYAYKSVGMTCNADAMDRLYETIDKRIEAAAKNGRMSVSFSLRCAVKEHMKVELSIEQLTTLSDKIKSKYKDNGFDVSLTRWNYSPDDINIKIGWFLL